jgi:hypothetical protein
MGLIILRARAEAIFRENVPQRVFQIGREQEASSAVILFIECLLAHLSEIFLGHWLLGQLTQVARLRHDSQPLKAGLYSRLIWQNRHLDGVGVDHQLNLTR